MLCPKCGFMMHTEPERAHPDACNHCYCEKHQFENGMGYMQCCRCKVILRVDPGEPYFTEP